MTNDAILPDDPQAHAAARVLALLDASRHSLAALAAAVDLASQRDIELVALYVEDLDLLRCAAFPFSREIGAQSGLARPFTPDTLKASIERQRQRVAQALLSAVAGRSLSHRLEVSRGQVATAALALAGPGDVLVVGKAGMSERWGTRLGSTSRRLILEAPCTVLLWDERKPYRRGPLRRLMPPSGSDERQPTALIVDWLVALFDGIAPLPLQHARELEVRLAHADAGGLLLTRAELETLLQEDEALIARVPLPILVIP